MYIVIYCNNYLMFVNDMPDIYIEPCLSINNIIKLCPIAHICGFIE